MAKLKKKSVILHAIHIDTHIIKQSCQDHPLNVESYLVFGRKQQVKKSIHRFLTMESTIKALK